MSDRHPDSAGRYLRFTLAVLPFIGMLVLIPWVNRTTPFVLGMPFLLFWVVIWVVLTSACLTVIYWTDPANKKGTEHEEQEHRNMKNKSTGS